MIELGWWVISGEAIQEMLWRVALGEDPELVLLEEYANGTHEQPAEGDE